MEGSYSRGFNAIAPSAKRKNSHTAQVTKETEHAKKLALAALSCF